MRHHVFTKYSEACFMFLYLHRLGSSLLLEVTGLVGIKLGIYMQTRSLNML